MRKEWIDAAKLLAEDPTKSVICPECKTHIIEVVDVDSPNNPSDIERYLTCPHCKLRTILRMKRKC